MESTAYLWAVDPREPNQAMTRAQVEKMEAEWNELFTEKRELRLLELVRAGSEAQRAALGALGVVLKREPAAG